MYEVTEPNEKENRMQTNSKWIGGVGVVAAIMLGTVITLAGLASAQDHKHDSQGKNQISDPSG